MQKKKDSIKHVVIRFGDGEYYKKERLWYDRVAKIWV